MNPYFSEVKKNFGFGCMRLPMKMGKVDYSEFTKMVDTFIENGFNYFDTAHGYLDGKSEIALRDCLTSRYPRESYILTDKLSEHTFKKQEDIRVIFQKQLEACGVEYFDFYLMHAQNAKFFEKYKKCRAYETAFELKEEGKIKHVGLSFHDKAKVLDQILTEYPQIEVVQIQFNYVDYDNDSVEGRKCYEVCRKHNKPIIVMEPVKGGTLAKLPRKAQKVIDSLQGGSAASYAIRFAAGFEGIMMVLSGMGDMDMMNDNLSFMKDFHPLSSEERAAVDKVGQIFREKVIVPCTGCRYCTEVCPNGIAIPDLFARLNAKRLLKPLELYPINGELPSACVKCGQCEGECPQNLPIRELLETAAKELNL